MGNKEGKKYKIKIHLTSYVCGKWPFEPIDTMEMLKYFLQFVKLALSPQKKVGTSMVRVSYSVFESFWENPIKFGIRVISHIQYVLVHVPVRYITASVRYAIQKGDQDKYVKIQAKMYENMS